MSPIVVLQMPNEAVETDLWGLLGYRSLVEEAGNDYRVHESPRVRIEVKRTWMDRSYCWRLAVVLLDGQPVMITQNAGRSGDDHVERIILSRARFLALIQHLQELQKPLEIVEGRDYGGVLTRVVEDLGGELPGLGSFYGGNLDGWLP